MTHVAVRRLFRVVNGGTPTSDEANWGDDVLWATPIDLAAVDGGSILSTTRTLTRTGLASGSAAVPEGSLVLSTRAPIGYVAATTAETAFNQGCRGLVPRVEVDLRFFRYQFLARRLDLVSLGQGSTFLELSTDALAALKLTRPPLSEQRETADFLDAETGRIDSLIEKKERVIELVGQRHVALIDRQVASVPSSRLRLSRLLETRLMDGPHETPEFVDDGVPFLSVDNVVEDRLVFDRTRRISRDAHQRYAAKCLPRRGDVIVTKAASIGRVALVETDLDFNVWSPLAVLRPDIRRIDPAFLYHALRSTALQDAIQLAASSNTQKNVAMTDLAAVHIPVPDLASQRRVAQRLTEDRLRTDEIRMRMRRQVTLLREHRQALITAAVTGSARDREQRVDQVTELGPLTIA